jgi:hypothetical protein
MVTIAINDHSLNKQFWGGLAGEQSSRESCFSRTPRSFYRNLNILPNIVNAVETTVRSNNWKLQQNRFLTVGSSVGVVQ